jgi:ATP-dependent Lon protease
LKTIQEELGQNPSQEELDNLEKRAKKMKWPEKIAKAFDKELKRARRTNPQVAEYSVLLNYLELMLDLPWGVCTEDNFNLKKVERVLDKDHYGLEEVKKRILEHLAVLKLKGNMKAPIICLVGPPGVGKTSLGKSISMALKRNFVRVSLGGLHDESEIRGHRKTYIGAMPGRIIQSLKKAKSSNPVFILDEIDKIGNSHRGDPSSALLEVLDPEQNDSFYDNYLEQEYDLSKVLFIATANSLSTIQAPLRDRMEIIQIDGYSVEEKVQIAKQHLVVKEKDAHGLERSDVKINPKILKHIIQNYTKESGVRNLSRKIAGVMRSVAKRKAFEEDYNVSVTKEDVETYLGPTIYDNDMYDVQKVPGVAVGLAWTQVGGDILFIETSSNQGSGKLTLTGNLGDVMKESATTALSYIKANAESLGIDIGVVKKTDIHIHVPQGAIPKDGPSAGITMLSALTSLLTKVPLKSHLAMTGEITLRGKVLPVGGIKEKILAAKRAGIKEVILCKANKKHIDKITEAYIIGMSFHYVDRMDEVLRIALG